MNDIQNKIKIASEIEPSSNYAVVDAKNIRGGLHNVQTREDIEFVVADLKKVGMIFYVETESVYYEYQADGSLKKLVDLDGYLRPENFIASDNIVIDTSNEGNVEIAAVIGDLPENQVYSEALIDVDVALPIVNITTTSNPSLLPNKQDVIDDELMTEDKTVVGAINEVLEGMKEIERDAIAAQIGSPATRKNTAFELANIIGSFNKKTANSLSNGGIMITAASPTYSDIVNAAEKAFGNNDGSSGATGKWLSMYYQPINTKTGNLVDYIKLGYDKKQAATMCIPKNGYDIEMPRKFQNVIVKGTIYMGSSSLESNIRKGKYDEYMCVYYIVYMTDTANSKNPSDANSEGAFAYLITTKMNTAKLGVTYKLMTTMSENKNNAAFITQNNKLYFSINLNGGTSSSDDKMYWDSYCEGLYAWDNY